MQPTLSRRILASYSGVSVPLAAMAMPISVYLPPFYGESMGLSLTTVGLIFTLARIWDVVTDPVMGAIIDRFDTRWGRRKHWIAIAVPLLMLSVWMVFMPNPDRVSPAYLGFWLVLLYVGYTMMTIAHQSWGAELTTTYDDRSRLYGWREVFVIGGMTLVLAIPALVELFGSGEAALKVASMGWFCLILFPLTALPTLLFVPDARNVVNRAIEWQEAAKVILTNRTLWRLLLTDLTTGFASTASGALYIFFATYVFELSEHASIALLFYFLASFAAMPAWLKIAYRLGKDRTIKIALLYGVTIKIGLYFVAEPGNVALFWGYTLIYGVAFGAAPALLRSMMADLTDEDALRSGKQRAGLFFALLTTTNKLGSAIAVGTVLTLIERLFGFTPGADNSPAAIEGLFITYCAAPFLALGVAYLPLIRYPLNRERHAEIRVQLARLEAQSG
ncbi:MAG: MFS transporter [Gammaproteobacteria bacterium]|nr:MFS transporter [Gammaproteobacteria bacterium]MYE52062.1 MFS transporter [Gammaproteobacteria bacterium]